MSEPITLIEMVEKYLRENGYDGLYHEDGECACEVDDLAPCGEPCMGCSAGHKHVATGVELGYEAGEWVIAPTKTRPTIEDWPKPI